MSLPNPIRVMSVDDHPLMRQGIATMIRDQPDMVLVAEAASGAEAMTMYRAHRPDITLMDLRLPDRSGIDVLIAIRSEFAEARVIMLTTFEGDVEMQRDPAVEVARDGLVGEPSPEPEPRLEAILPLAAEPLVESLGEFPQRRGPRVPRTVEGDGLHARGRSEWCASGRRWANRHTNRSTCTACAGGSAEWDRPRGVKIV